MYWINNNLLNIYLRSKKFGLKISNLARTADLSSFTIVQFLDIT